ncbi:MAG TPA: 16S rRNA (adenine(1518)-N(6)/adenine(1519)-N(6))-dimethyltransferase RsmA [Bacteroidia bacterium]|nr:16S rRNA (adenine(1518)-N(6)/adenine(1519)-N(6))-dimethyltransferase RsmA [Bacteroidia bacterium]HNP98391.1 16S rRNA (adenine(1518)-N(6)/adenine(1519)-N(6))-dimethyltransferase RsmA [Bacteroidia bacterium]
MQQVRAKKHLGQHFLKDPQIGKRIVDSLQGKYKYVLEIGPGMGILSHFLFEHKEYETFLIDIDQESIHFLRGEFPFRQDRIIEGDFLQFELQKKFNAPVAIIGNFPYNISSQILFKVLDNKDFIPEVVGMFQKEVAERIASGPGNRDYGILSVFMQMYYDVELLFVLDQKDFNPPPKVKSAVLRFTLKPGFVPDCDEKLFRRVVKVAFNQRRKTLRNALSAMTDKSTMTDLPFLDLRAERLSWQDFVVLTNAIAKII